VTGVGLCGALCGEEPARMGRVSCHVFHAAERPRFRRGAPWPGQAREARPARAHAPPRLAPPLAVPHSGRGRVRYPHAGVRDRGDGQNRPARRPAARQPPQKGDSPVRQACFFFRMPRFSLAGHSVEGHERPLPGRRLGRALRKCLAEEAGSRTGPEWAARARAAARRGARPAAPKRTSAPPLPTLSAARQQRGVRRRGRWRVREPRSRRRPAPFHMPTCPPNSPGSGRGAGEGEGGGAEGSWGEGRGERERERQERCVTT